MARSGKACERFRADGQGLEDLIECARRQPFSSVQRSAHRLTRAMSAADRAEGAPVARRPADVVSAPHRSARSRQSSGPPSEDHAHVGAGLRSPRSRQSSSGPVEDHSYSSLAQLVRGDVPGSPLSTGSPHRRTFGWPLSPSPNASSIRLDAPPSDKAVPGVDTLSTWKLMTLTLAIAGAQVAWTIEQARCAVEHVQPSRFGSQSCAYAAW